MKKFLLLFVLSVLVLACSSKTNVEPAKYPPNSPEAAVVGLLDGMIAGDYVEASRYTDEPIEPEDMDMGNDGMEMQLIKALFSSMSYGELQLVNKDAENAIVQVEITTKDAEAAMIDLFSTLFTAPEEFGISENTSEEEAQAIILQAMTEAIHEAPTKTAIASFELEFTDDRWLVTDMEGL